MRRALQVATTAKQRRVSAFSTAAARLHSSRSSTDPQPSPEGGTSPAATEGGVGRRGGQAADRRGKDAPGPTVMRDPVKTLYPKIRLRAQTERPAPRLPEGNDDDEERDMEYVRAREPRDPHGPLLQKKKKTVKTVKASFAEAPGEPEQRQQHPREEDKDADDSATAAAAAAAGTTSAAPTTTPTVAAGSDLGHSVATSDAPQLNEVESFLEAVQQQVEASRLERNQAIPYPEHPDTMVPLFRRMKRHTKMQVIAEDPDFPTFSRMDSFVALPPTGKHPWVKNTPIGHVIHGDGQLGVVGTGEVGFEDTRLIHTNPITGEADDENESGATPNKDKYVDELTLREERRGWRGLQHQSILQRHLPQNNGKTLQDAVVKHSFSLTGRGVFATRDVKQGETIMIVASSAQSLGVKGEIRRLEDMVADILLATYEACCSPADSSDPVRDGGDHRQEQTSRGSGLEAEHGHRSSSPSATAAADAALAKRGEEMKAFLHDWILTGQPSSLVEHWPRESTQRVLDAIGGRDVLDALELHTIHIARLAAIIDLNSFLVESFYAERKGMAYFPEAGFLNHSCVPNATYDILPEHTFRESDYYIDEVLGHNDSDENDNGDTNTEDTQELAKAQGGGIETEPAARRDPPSSAPPPPLASHERAGGDGAGSGGAEEEALAAAATTTGQAAAASTSVVKVKQQNSGIDYLEHFDDLPDLTESGAPRYLFCCRAEKDIKAGEEILISYIPPGWSFDNRQYVLHDRYHFWCKCPKCSPVIDKKYARVPRFLVGIVVLSVLLQGLVLYQRDRKNDVDEELERLNAMSDEERIEELRARGIDLEDISMDAKVRKREENYKKGRVGMFEMLEREKLRRAYEIEGAISPNEELAESQNPYPRKPFGL